MPKTHKKEHIVVIGAGINGLVASNYLVRDGFKVTLLERKEKVGGACASHTVTIKGKTYEYPNGASVFGFMQDFVFEETGLKDHVTIWRAKVPYAVSFEDRKNSRDIIWGDSPSILKHAVEEWGEKGDMDAFVRDNATVRTFLLHGYRRGVVPTVKDAEEAIGKRLTKLWITGTARALVDHYFTTEEMKVFTLIPVNESGPVSIDEPFSAFTIPLMSTGSVFNGEWGYVKGGIWHISNALAALNRKAGVEIITSAIVTNVNAEKNHVTYRHEGTQKTLSCDAIVFATDPVHAAAVMKDTKLLKSLTKKKLLGSSGKQLMFFRKPVQWNDDGPDPAMFRFLFFTKSIKEFEKRAHSVIHKKDFDPGYLEIYPEDAAYRAMGLKRGYDMLAVYSKHFSIRKHGKDMHAAQKKIDETILSHVRNKKDFVGSILVSPKDLAAHFGFPQGNIDHVEIANGQTFIARTYSANPKKSFFQFGKHDHVFYCGAGTYPCGSIAGTPGYMCAKNIKKLIK